MTKEQKNVSVYAFHYTENLLVFLLRQVSLIRGVLCDEINALGRIVNVVPGSPPFTEGPDRSQMSVVGPTAGRLTFLIGQGIQILFKSIRCEKSAIIMDKLGYLIEDPTIMFTRPIGSVEITVIRPSVQIVQPRSFFTLYVFHGI